jgi:competence protein ComEC
LAAALAILVPAALAGSASARLLVAAFAVAGWSSGSAAAHRAASDCRAGIADGATIQAVAVPDGRMEAGGAIVLRLEQVRSRGRSVVCHGEIRARLPASLPTLAPGSHVAVTGSWWAWSRRSLWPVAGQHTGVLSVRSLRAAAADHDHPLIAARVRALARVSTLFPRERPLAEALVMAHRESLDTGLRQDFAASGLTHLLAISGSHVGVVTAMILLLARMSGMRSRPATIVATAGSAAYVLFLGAPAAAARAALQGFSILASRMLQRPADPLALLASAALLLMAHDPLVLLDIGFQLSFAGVFGLIAFQRAAHSMLPATWPRSIATALAATLAATFTTGPIVAFHFGVISWISPLANLVAGPLVALAVPALALALALSAIHAGAAAFMAGGGELLLRALREVAHAAASLPGSHSYIAWNAAFAALVALLAALLVIRGGAPTRAAAHGAPRRDTRKLAVRAAFALCVFALWPLLQPGGNGSLEIHAIDVGQGDAFAIRSPHGRWFMVDTGPATERFDAGRTIVAPYLLDRGARRIETIILTHPHADHIGGVRSLWQMFDTGPIFDPAIATAQPYYLDVLTAARQQRLSWFAARAGREIRFDDLTIQILAPADSLLDDVTDPNDLSVVLRLVYGDFAALFLGDAPRAVENRLVAAHGTRIESDLLKVGHHGSRTSTGDSLLQTVRPRLALVSVGRRNRYGHPNPAVLQRLEQYGVRVIRTDLRGSTIVRARPDGSMQLVANR